MAILAINAYRSGMTSRNMLAIALYTIGIDHR